MEIRLGQRVASGTIVLCVAASLAITGCSDSTGPEARVSIVPANKTIVVQTNSAGFSSIQIPITITNTSEQVIAYSFCGAQLEQNTTSGWQPIWFQACALAETAWEGSETATPLLLGPNLAPGQSASFTAIVPVSDQPVRAGDHSSIRGEPGEYRLRFLVATEFAGSVFVFPRDASVSESFNVVVQ